MSTRDSLSPDDLRRLIEILTRFGRIDTVEARQAFLLESGLLPLERHLHLSESTHQFAMELIREAQRVGSFTAGGEPAFYQLLGYLQKQVEGHPEEHDFVAGLRRTATSPVTRTDTLQPPSIDFTGRIAEIGRLTKALREGRPVMISGMGGIGKSDLARKVAEEVRAEFAGPALQVKLQPDNKPVSAAELAGTLILGLQPTAKLPDTLAERVVVLRTLMQGQKGILLLDNAASRTQIQPLTGAWRGWAVLVTSRKEFDVPEAITEELEALKQLDSEKLLKLHLERKGRRESSENLKLVAHVCHHHPLAVVIAASFLGINKGWKVKDYLEKVKKRVLDGFIPKKDEYDNLAAVLGISIEELKQDDPTLCDRWHLLALMPDAFNAELARALLGELIEDEYPDVEPLDEVTTKTTLDTLTRLNLLETIPPTEENEVVRYRLHDFLTDYALHHSSHHPSQASQEQAIRRHALTVLRQGSALNELYKAGKPVEALVQFDALWNHLNGAWQKINQGEDATATFVIDKFTARMPYLLDLRLPPRTSIPYYKAALRAAHIRNDRSNEAVHLGNLGLVYADLGETRTAINHYEEALAIAKEISDKLMEGTALSNLGNAYADLGEVRPAIDYYEQALSIDRDIGNKRGESIRLGNLGNAYANLGEVRPAIDYYEQALVIAREIGDTRSEGAHITNLGVVYENLGETSKAITYYEQALVIDREIGDKRGEGIDCWNLALAYKQEGKGDKAITFARTALILYEATEHPDREKVRSALREWDNPAKNWWERLTEWTRKYKRL